MSTDPGDDEFSAQLAAIVDADVDDVPEDLSDFARASRTWAVLDDQLGELVDSEATAEVRSTITASSVFDLGAHEVIVALRDDVLVGEVTPIDDQLLIEVQTLELVRSVELDDLGRFRARDVMVPFRVRLTSPTLPRSAVTPWVTF